ncbi:MAG: 50S ribosomal protein L11 methyltransferase [Oscillospiraceae bacterium]|nr:50S ribosomal protein L11 methyltransferase [Oscillospiraceae bacterium]
MRWLEVCVEAGARGTEKLCAFLEDLGVSGLVVEDEADLQEFMEKDTQYWDYIDEDFVASRRGLCRVKFYLPEDEEGRKTLLALREALEKAGYPAPVTASLRDEDWENNWKQYYRPIAVGKRLLIVPEWEAVPESGGRLPLRLNPGLIFGTGAHPSTRMCLEAAEALAPAAEAVLDLGCGSGILSIAALVLGAKTALGCDIDPKAPEIARMNAALNGTEDRLEVLAGDALSDYALRSRIGLRRYPLIFLNIVADVIIALSRDAARWLEPGGSLICSGIIDGREKEVQAALEAAGLTITAHRQEENWHSYTAKGGR